jgi:hypothetical protein
MKNLSSFFESSTSEVEPQNNEENVSSNSAQKTRMAFGAAAIGLTLLGAFGAVKGTDMHFGSKPAQNTSLHFSEPVSGPAGKLASSFKNTIRSDVESVKPSAGLYAMERLMNPFDLANVMERNPEGERGIFDIPGIDKKTAVESMTDTSDYPYMALVESVIEDSSPAQRTLSGGNARSFFSGAVVMHEEQAGILFQAGDIEGAQKSAKSVLQILNFISEDGIDRYRSFDNREAIGEHQNSEHRVSYSPNLSASETSDSKVNLSMPVPVSSDNALSKSIRPVARGDSR